MRVVIQRIARAEVRVHEEIVGSAGKGLLLFVAIEKGDTENDLDWFCDKVLQLRVFEDNSGKMNLSALDTGAEILVVSQFTLAADLERGRRPGFERAAPPEQARSLFDVFVQRLKRSPLSIATGRFREFMQVELVNDGPVTFVLDRKRR